MNRSSGMTSSSARARSNRCIAAHQFLTSQVTPRPSSACALAIACVGVGLNGDGAQVLYDWANTVYKLASQPIVARLRYASPPSPWMDRLSVSVRATASLKTLGFPAVRPLEVEQSVTRTATS